MSCLVPGDVCSGPTQETYSKDGFVTVRGHSKLMLFPRGFVGSSTVEPITGDSWGGWGVLSVSLQC